MNLIDLLILQNSDMVTLIVFTIDFFASQSFDFFSLLI